MGESGRVRGRKTERENELEVESVRGREGMERGRESGRVRVRGRKGRESGERGRESGRVRVRGRKGRVARV